MPKDRCPTSSIKVMKTGGTKRFSRVSQLFHPDGAPTGGRACGAITCWLIPAPLLHEAGLAWVYRSSESFPRASESQLSRSADLCPVQSEAASGFVPRSRYRLKLPAAGVAHSRKA